MKLIKKYKIVLIAAFALIMIFGVIGTIKILYPDSSKSYYGTRLEGIEKVTINDNTYKKVKEALLKTNKVISVDAYTTGRIVNILIKVNKDVDKITSEGFADTAYETFSENEKAYYDFQIFLTSEDEKDEIYPRIGYKSKNSLSFKWTNN